MSEKLKNVIEWIECIVIAVVLALLIRYYVGTPTVVQMESMYPTLKQGERLILNRIPRTTKKTPERGDIITFEQPSKTYISPEEADLNNPVAIYDNEPTNVFAKFAYYVLEWGKTSYIKRVIALPGEHVQIKEGKVYINGNELDESSYLKDDVQTPCNGNGNAGALFLCSLGRQLSRKEEPIGVHQRRCALGQSKKLFPIHHQRIGHPADLLL